MRNLLDDNEPLVSGLVNTELTTAQILRVLSDGGSIQHIKMGFTVWLSGSKLASNEIGWVGSLPGIIFNNDIKWMKVIK